MAPKTSRISRISRWIQTLMPLGKALSNGLLNGTSKAGDRKHRDRSPDRALPRDSAHLVVVMVDKEDLSSSSSNSSS